MKTLFRILSCFALSMGSFGRQPDASYPGGILSEVMHLITNGTVEHFVGCNSQDNITEDDIAYYLFTKNSKNRTALTVDNLYKLDYTKDTKIIFEGWLQTTYDPNMLDLVQAYLTRYKCNVIFVEYINLTNTQYTQAYCNVIKGAQMIGDFLCTMHSKGYLDFNKVHMVGLSIGGQIMGLIGQRVQKKCKQKVDRITGLDPAGPIYQDQPISMRLDKSDANFVDVIHTNMGMFGYYGSMGHVDFFPNCGSIQPSCLQPDNFPDVFSTLVFLIQCSHGRGVQLFNESIYGPVFNSTSCTLCPNSNGIGRCAGADVINPKYTIMGEDCPRNPPAERFYLKTNGKPPYAIA